MRRADRNALVGTILVLLLGLGFGAAGSDGGALRSGIPVFAICVAVSFLIQWVVFVPSYLCQTEKYFDLTGGATYAFTVLIAFALGSQLDARSTILSSMVLIWATRLAFFLYRRVLRAGKDGRFDDLKTSFFRFLGAWTLQGLWVTFTSAAAWAAITSLEEKPADGWLVAGTIVWLFGFGIEVVADWQKSRFAARERNRGRFIQEGLWAYSRHPNYLGEIVLWTGVAIAGFPALQGWQLLALSSPVFVAILLLRVSGIPLLEERADKKWGGEEDYERYKRETPVLVPFLGRRS